MKEILVYFFRIGCLGFGGPLALVAQMQKELVVERKWMHEDDFRAAFGMIKSMPGTVAFQTAVFLARQRGGFWGAALAGFVFILPSFLMMVALAACYQQMSDIIWLRNAMHGMQIAAFALIAWALKSLGQGFFRKPIFWLLSLLAVLVFVYQMLPEPILIVGAGALAVALAQMTKPTAKTTSAKLYGMSPLLLPLLWVCFKAGAFVFGTGLAIVPLLENDFVSRLQWLSHSQFMDALSFGQLTPGPVVITVTFIGYKVAGMSGALVATAGVFGPSFFHMTTWFPRMLDWLLKQKWIQHFSMGVTAAVCSTIAVSLFRIGQAWSTIDIGLSVLFLAIMYFSKLPSWMLILLGAFVGYSLGILQLVS